MTESDIRRELAEERLDEYPHEVLGCLLHYVEANCDSTPYDDLRLMSVDDCTPLQLLRRLVLTDECGELMHRFRERMQEYGGPIDVVADEITEDEISAVMVEIEENERAIAETEASLMPGRV